MVYEKLHILDSKKKNIWKIEKCVIPSHSTINEVYKIIIIVKKKFMKLRIYI
jgi:hypothetical protein